MKIIEILIRKYLKNEKNVVKYKKKIKGGVALKKIILIVMSVFMCMCLFACSSDDNADFNVSYTDENGDPTPEPESISLGRSIEITVVEITDDNINIRTGAGTGNEIVGVAQAGHNYVLVKEGSSWNEIEYEDGSAYVYGDFCIKKSVNIEEIDALIALNDTILGSEAENSTDDTTDDSSDESADDSTDPVDTEDDPEYE